ncbi:YesL family protein [Paenibacillus physcomitrellae]|uniref:DUF624 domain-containing protein n=1 Tax=Paenibacillus physcomitrellae TaxID=1619311 RepID=A0ABQ1GJ19_9BACL|nr:DUF624 domain-containing protein [Paenibacillus physcomitrellae]GGA44611.1 hypothetical protein GCM10010917_32400 [Paenibacillus physcomitrellae]
MEFRGVMGGLYRITEWIMRIAGSNLLWLVCSSPFLFFLLTKYLMIVNGLENDASSLYAMAILAPFTLFPATAALFTVVRKWVMGESDVSVTRTFFRGYKENYKQSMIGGIFYTLLFVIMVIDYRVYMVKTQNLQLIGIIMLLLLILLLVSLFNFFSMVAHYHLKTTTMLKNAVLLTIIRPFRSFSTLAGAAVLLFLTAKFTWLIIFGTASLIAWLAFLNFFATYTKMQAQIAKMNEKAEAKAAAEANGSLEAEEPNSDAGQDKDPDKRS